MHNLYDTLAVFYKYKKLYERRCQGVMKKYDLRIADIDVLYFVAHTEGKKYARDIADGGMSKANVSKSVEHLHQKGLVELCADVGDRRCVHIEPTDLANELVAEVQQIRREMSDSLYGDISEEDKAVVSRIMQQVSEKITTELYESE